MRITIIGYGAFGSALSDILLANGHELAFYDPIKFPTMPLNTACDFGEYLIFAAPSSTLRDTIRRLSLANRKKPFILASKGLADMTLISRLNTPMILSGPSFAADLKSQKPTTFTITSPHIKSLFDRPWLTFEISRDIHGIILCGSLKNIYAIYAGLHHITPATPEYRAFLISATKEIKLILKENSCKPSTFDLSCGFRDLALTASDPRSRNYTYGKSLSKNKSQPPKNLVEGLSALRAMLDSKFFFIPPNFETSLPLFFEVLSKVKL